MKTAPVYLPLMVMALLLCAVSAWAKGTANVKNTIHNMSSSAPYVFYKSDESEVCIFCHTPHGGVLTGPLWNRSLATGPWTHYNSATLSTYLQGLSASRAVNDESLLCMACHDGSISVMHLLNPSNTLGRNPQSTFVVGSDDIKIVPLFDGSPGAKIGGIRGNAGVFGNLTDDHPISFSYDSVLGSAEYAGGGAKENQLRIVGTTGNATSALGWQGEGVRFFGTDNRVECSSCHDPHVDYETDAVYTPFLIRPNDGSNLCLACHNK
jgi:predicted CXXCH cytochrome family protein